SGARPATTSLAPIGPDSAPTGWRIDRPNRRGPRRTSSRRADCGSGSGSVGRCLLDLLRPRSTPLWLCLAHWCRTPPPSPSHLSEDGRPLIGLLRPEPDPYE